MTGKRLLLVSTAALALMLHVLPAGAETVTRTVTETTPDSVVVHDTATTTSPSATTVTKSVTTEGDGSQTVHTTVTTAPAATTSETHWTSTEKTVLVPGSRAISVRVLDLNGDGILTRAEIGKSLFKMFDTDGNDVIDNNEYERRAVLTVTPVEKETVISYDFDGDGVADKITRTYETFMRDSLLARFDRRGDGLSPHEFTEMDFYHADTNHDKGVELREWQGTYDAEFDHANKVRAMNPK